MGQRTPLRFDVFATIADASKKLREIADDIEKVGKELKKVDGKKADIKVTADTKKAQAELQKTKKDVEDLDGKKAKVEVDAETKDAHKNIKALVARLESVSGRRSLVSLGIGNLPAVVGAIGTLAGEVAGLGSAFVAAGASAGAFGLVAAQVFKDVSDQSKELEKLTNKRKAAQERLTKAQMDYARSGKKSKAALNRIRNATRDLALIEKQREKILDKQIPTQRAFLKQLDSLKAKWTALVERMKPSVFRTSIAGLKTVEKLLPVIEKLAKPAAKAFKTFATELGQFIDSFAFQRLVRFMASEGGPAIVRFGRILINLGAIAANVVMAFAPMATEMTNGLLRLTNRWASLSATMESRPAFKEFIHFVRGNGPRLLDTLEALGAVLAALAKGAMDVSPAFLNVIQALAKATAWLLNLHPAVAATVVTLFSLSMVFRGLVRPLHTLGIALLALKEAIAFLIPASVAARLATLKQAAANRILGASSLSAAVSTMTLRGALLALGKATLVIAALVTTVKTIQSLRAQTSGTVQPTDTLTKSMTELARTGKFTGAFFQQFKPAANDAKNSLESFTIAARQITDPTFWERWIDNPGQNLLHWLSFGTLSTRMQDNVAKFKALDSALTGLVKNGRAPEAAAAFNKMAAELSKVGVKGSDLKTLFPQFTSSLNGSALAAATLTAETQRVDNALTALVDPALAAFNMSTQLSQGWKSLGTAFAIAHGKMKGNTDAVNQLRTAFSQQILTVGQLHAANLKSGMSIEAVRQKSQNYIAVLYAIAGRNQEARAKVDALSTALLGVAGKTATSKQAFIALATQMTGDKEKAQRLWEMLKKLDRTYKPKVDANTAAAEAKIKRVIKMFDGTKITLGVNVRTDLQEHGARRRFRGGIDKMRRGGTRAPGIATGPTVLMGEVGTGGEAFIPLGKAMRGRSESLLAQVANMFGMRLIKMADGGILDAGGGGGGNFSLGDILSSFRDTTKPASKGDVTAALRSRRRAVDQLKDAEAALRRARKSKDGDRIASAERRVRREREDLAVATSKLTSVERRYNISKQRPTTQLSGALSTSIATNAAFIKNLNTLTDRGFGSFAQQLLSMGGVDAQKLAADAVKLSKAKMKALQAKVATAQQQAATLAALPTLIAQKMAAQANPRASAEMAARGITYAARGAVVGPHVATSPTIMYGERGSEAYIPLGTNMRGRAEQLLAAVAKMFGGQYIPMAAGGTVGAGGQAPAVNTAMTAGATPAVKLTGVTTSLAGARQLATAADAQAVVALKALAVTTEAGTTKQQTLTDSTKAHARAVTVATGKTTAMRAEMGKTQGQINRTAQAASALTGRYRGIPKSVHTAISVRASGKYTIQDFGKFAGGGPVFGPGTESSDSIPALLSNREYVVQANAHRHYGTRFLDQINARRFAKGGAVANFGGPTTFDAMPGHVRGGLNSVNNQSIKWTAKYTAAAIKKLLRGPIGVVKAAASMIGRGDDRGENNNWLTRAAGMPGAPWCFAAGTLVDTPAGMVPIEDIRTGDRVFTATGSPAPVSATLRRRKLLFRLVALGIPETFVTEDHPYWAMRRTSPSKRPRELEQPRWIKAGDLKRGDMIAMPLPPEGITRFSPDLAYVLGMYVADGHRLHRDKGVQFSDHASEAERIISALKRAGYEDVRIHPHRTRLTFTVYDRDLYELCGHFGDLAHRKKIPGSVFKWRRQARNALLEGYSDGDGNHHPDLGWQATTVSKALALGMAKLLRSLGHAPSVRVGREAHTAVIEGRTVSCRKSYVVQWKPWAVERPQFFESGGYLWAPVRELSATNRIETVYDITVPGEHSFVADGAAVHNCALFVSQAIRMAKAGRLYPGYPSAAVASFVGGMRHVPLRSGQPGDLAAYRGSGHINVIAGRAGGAYITIGGNEGPRVKRGVRGGQSSILRPKGFAAGGRVDMRVFRESNLDPADRRDPLNRLYNSLPPRQALATAAAFAHRERIEHRARGGPVLPGHSYVVGERGPELFSPAGTGRIHPSGATVNLTIEHFHARDGADIDLLTHRLGFAVRSASFG